MRRLVLSMMALSLAAAPALLSAQTPQDGEARRGHAFVRGHADPATRVLALSEQLGLTGEQVARLEAIQARYAAANQPLIEQLREAMPERGQFRGQRGERAERMRELTPEQHAEMRERMAERMQDMTPEQREQMRARMAERRAERGDRAQHGERGAEMRERMEALRPVMEQLRENQRQARSEVQEVLTSEQQSALRSLHEERRKEMRERGERGERGEHRGHRWRGQNSHR